MLSKRKKARIEAVMAQRQTGIVRVGKNKYICEDCGETRSIASKGKHWSNRKGTICRGRPAKHGKFNAVDREKIAKQKRERDDKHRPKVYATETGDSIRPIYIGKHHQ